MLGRAPSERQALCRGSPTAVGAALPPSCSSLRHAHAKRYCTILSSCKKVSSPCRLAEAAAVASFSIIAAGVHCSADTNYITNIAQATRQQTAHCAGECSHGFMLQQQQQPCRWQPTAASSTAAAASQQQQQERAQRDCACSWRLLRHPRGVTQLRQETNQAGIQAESPQVPPRKSSCCVDRMCGCVYTSHCCGVLWRGMCSWATQ